MQAAPLSFDDTENSDKIMKASLPFKTYLLCRISNAAAAALASLMVFCGACGSVCEEFRNCNQNHSACGGINVYKFSGGPYSLHMANVLADECPTGITADALRERQYYGSYSIQYGTLTVGVAGSDSMLVLFQDVVVCNKGVSNQEFVVTESMCQYTIGRLTTIDMTADDQFALNVIESRRDLRGTGCMWPEGCKITYGIQLKK